MTEENFYYTIEPKTQAITPILFTVTLRDQFAMAALPLVYPSTSYPIREIAEAAYSIADAMMEARK